MGRTGALAAALVAALLALSGAGAAATQQTPNLGGTIVVAQPEEPACLNRLLATCVDGPGSVGDVVEKVLLPAFDVDGRFRYRPRLVSGVSVSRTPPVTLTYHIRPQARWSDGVPVTAADFVFTHAARLKLASSLPQTERAQLRHVLRVTAIGAKTVRVTLREPFSGWHALFPNVLPQHVLRGVDLSTIWVDRVDDPRTGDPIGDGPFLVGSHERGKALTLVRNPAYWGTHLARVDRLVLRPVEDAVDSLAKGEVDLALFVPPALTAPFRADREFRVTSPPGSGYEHLAMRQGRPGHPALRNPLVRRALAYGIDREAIMRAVGRPDRPLQSVAYIVQSPYRRPNWQSYRRRPTLARSLLARAGCRRGPDGIYSCAGRRLRLRLVTSPVVPTRPTVMAMVQAQLRKVGVEVVPTYVSPTAFFDTVLPRGQFDLALFGWFFDPDPVAVMSVYSCHDASNYTGYCSRSVSRALAGASRILDPAAQARVLNTTDRMIAADAPVLPLYQARPSAVVRTSVKDYVRLPYNPFADAENWWLDR